MTRYQELSEKIAIMIEQGVLRPGERIASVRRAMAQHRASPATVVQAYALLEARGLIEGRPRSGFYVRARHPAAAPAPSLSPPPSRAVKLDVDTLIFRILDAIRQRDVVPFASAFPSPGFMPLDTLNRTAATMARKASNLDSLSDLPSGHAELRRQIALRYLESGCAIAADEIIVTNGAMEAIHLGLMAVTRPGDTVAVEYPTFYGTLQAIGHRGLRAVQIRTDPRTGLDVAALAGALDKHRIKACVLMPGFQNPLGATMPDEAKGRLVALLARHAVPLVEDDPYAELYFGSVRPKPAKAFDRQGLVLHCGSFAKCLAPGYRIGWIAAGRYRDDVERLKFITSIATASLPQAAIAEYLRHGGFDRHLRNLRRTLALQMHKLGTAIGEAFPGDTRMTRPQGGYQLWVELPAKADALRLFDEALARKISIAPGPIFSAEHGFRNCMRLNFGHPWNTKAADAVQILGKLVARMAR